MGMKDDVYDKISLRAYYQYVNRGRIDGYALDDWLAAEREVSPMPAGNGNAQPKLDKRNRRKPMTPAQSRMRHAE
jgi:hypothetical protein